MFSFLKWADPTYGSANVYAEHLAVLDVSTDPEAQLEAIRALGELHETPGYEYDVIPRIIEGVRSSRESGHDEEVRIAMMEMLVGIEMDIEWILDGFTASSARERVTAIRILDAMPRVRMQEKLLSHPMAVNRLCELLKDPVVIVRNMVLLMLGEKVTAGNETIQKIMAFEGVLETVLEIAIREQGEYSGVISSDCMAIVMNLLHGNPSNKKLFRELGYVRFIPQLAEFLLESNPQSFLDLLQELLSLESDSEINAMQKAICLSSPDLLAQLISLSQHVSGTLIVLEALLDSSIFACAFASAEDIKRLVALVPASLAVIQAILASNKSPELRLPPSRFIHAGYNSPAQLALAILFIRGTRLSKLQVLESSSVMGHLEELAFSQDIVVFFLIELIHDCVEALLMLWETQLPVLLFDKNERSRAGAALLASSVAVLVPSIEDPRASQLLGIIRGVVCDKYGTKAIKDKIADIEFDSGLVDKATVSAILEAGKNLDQNMLKLVCYMDQNSVDSGLLSIGDKVAQLTRENRELRLTNAELKSKSETTVTDLENKIQQLELELEQAYVKGAGSQRVEELEKQNSCLLLLLATQLGNLEST